ncbi:hypothetical protein B0H13DRAFT_1924959 [Mycena leptocephala]|nr:hypothetical protein B0H13DRAFT_1924959 [Mycena leptocephala]
MIHNALIKVSSVSEAALRMHAIRGIEASDVGHPLLDGLEVVEAPTSETFIKLSPEDVEALHGASHEALLHARNLAYLELFAVKQALQSLCAQLVQAHRLLQFSPRENYNHIVKELINVHAQLILNPQGCPVPNSNGIPTPNPLLANPDPVNPPASIGDNVDGYQETLIKYSKRFALMEAPWVPVATFGPKVAAPSAPPEDIYSPDAALYLQHLTACIYARTPQKFHALIDATEFGPFSSNFIHFINAERSTVAHALKVSFKTVLGLCNIGTDKASLKQLLYFPGADPDKDLPKASAPLLYENHLDKKSRIFMQKALPLSFRCMVFGPGSLEEGSKKSPARNSAGYKWQIPGEGLTVASLAFTCDVTDKPSVQKIFQHWHSIVFVGVEDLSFENALADLDLNDQSDWDEIDKDLFRSSRSQPSQLSSPQTWTPPRSPSADPFSDLSDLPEDYADNNLPETPPPRPAGRHGGGRQVIPTNNGVDGSPPPVLAGCHRQVTWDSDILSDPKSAGNVTASNQGKAAGKGKAKVVGKGKAKAVEKGKAKAVEKGKSKAKAKVKEDSVGSTAPGEGSGLSYAEEAVPGDRE